jgi:superfamily II DNA helicase RecQ
LEKTVGTQKESANTEPLNPAVSDAALFVKLRKLRKEIAAREGFPAFVVFSDAVLKDICRKQPVSLVLFSSVNGVGSAKLEKYGKAFYRTNQGLSWMNSIQASGSSLFFLIYRSRPSVAV